MSHPCAIAAAVEERDLSAGCRIPAAPNPQNGIPDPTRLSRWRKAGAHVEWRGESHADPGAPRKCRDGPSLSNMSWFRKGPGLDSGTPGGRSRPVRAPEWTVRCSCVLRTPRRKRPARLSRTVSSETVGEGQGADAVWKSGRPAEAARSGEGIRAVSACSGSRKWLWILERTHFLHANR